MRNISKSWFLLDSISQDFLGEVNPINIAFRTSERGLIMIDTGIPGSLNLIERELDEAGLSLKLVKSLIITHHHPDHIGNINLIHQRYPNIHIYAHKIEIPYITGEMEVAKGNISIDELRELFPRVTRKQVEQFYKTQSLVFFNGNLRSISERESGEIPPMLRVIHTPGHTPGHICIYDPQEKILVAGDLMMYWKGKLRGPVASFSSNYTLAMRSLKKVLNLEVSTLVGYHGNIYQGNIQNVLE